MDFEELSKKIEELKAQGKTDEDILDIFFKAFTEEEMDAEDLRKAAGALGYEFSEEFETELSKEAGPEGGTPEDISQNEIEDTKMLDNGESKEEFQDKIEDINGRGETGNESNEGGEDESEPKDEDEGGDNDNDESKGEDEDEDAEWEKAQKMFKL